MSEIHVSEPAPVISSDRGLSLRGLYEVFTSPTKFFTELNARPKILVPYLVVAIVVTIFMVSCVDMIFQLQIQSPQFQEQLAQNPGMNVERMAGFMKPWIIVGGVITMLLAPLLYAGLAMLWGNFVLGGRGTFRHVLSATLYGEVLYAIGGMLLLLPLILAKGELGVSFSPAVLVASQGIESPMYALLSKFSVFHIWEIVALGIGYGIVFGLSRKRGYIIALLTIGLVAAIHVIWTFIASQLV